ncbi:MAG TPA: hypothetical protein VI542_12370 [Candidatus Tectomicrobia bacterium]
MCSQFLKVFNVSDGIMASDVTPDSQEGLYASPQELGSLFGCDHITEADVRWAMGLIHAHCNRPSLWPTEVLSDPIEVPEGRQETRLLITPVIRILEAAGRYSAGRRDKRGISGMYNTLNPLLVVASFGGATWTPIPLETLELTHSTGVVVLPWTNMLLPYSLVRFRYIGGYISIPHRVKAAVVEIINTTHAKGVSDRTRYAVGRITRQYASDSFITPQAEQLLAPFVIRSLY